MEEYDRTTRRIALAALLVLVGFVLLMCLLVGPPWVSP